MRSPVRGHSILRALEAGASTIKSEGRSITPIAEVENMKGRCVLIIDEASRSL